jgi:hypothetical protein
MVGPIRIEAPDALLGFLLMQRLPHTDARVNPDGDRWSVEIHPAQRDGEDVVEELVATVRRWLRDEHIPATTVHVNGDSFTVEGTGR